MSILTRVVGRASEISYLLARHAGDPGSMAALLDCYVRLLRTTTSSRRTDLRIRVSGRKFRVRMRQSDIFTLAEVLHQRQYRLATRLPQGAVIIDAGANIGISSLWFLGLYPTCALHCFEPEPENFALLTENLGSIPRVQLNQAALGSTSGKVRLRLSDHGAMHSTVNAAADPVALEVESQRLEDYLDSSGIERVDLLKLDVEGSELDTLRGLGRRLADVRTIVGELHTDVVAEDDFYGLLTAGGMRILSRQRIDSGDQMEVGTELFEATRE
jgi:FkbM family methyltransferase